jgi:hypothetical protein
MEENFVKTHSILLSFVTLLTAQSTPALELGHGFSLKGFGTAGLVYNGDREADFAAESTLAATGVGRTNPLTYAVDTKAGIQLDWQVTDRFSLTAQTLAKQFPDRSWNPQLEWGYLKFKVTPNLDLRAGRIRPPIYLLSDYLDVNYANPWVRPPVEFYSVTPIRRMEGGDLLWRPQTGAITWLVQPYVGRSQTAARGGEIGLDQILGLNVSASLGDFTLRTGYIHTRMTVTSNFMDLAFGAFAQLCNLGDQTACKSRGELNHKDREASFGSLGLTWDNGDYFISGEWGRRDTDTSIADLMSWYLTGGARFGRWTPYLIYSEMVSDSPLDHERGSPMTNFITTGLLRGNPTDQRTLSLGVRYDLMDNLAIKAQWDHTMTECITSPDPWAGQATGTCGGWFILATEAFTRKAQAIDLLSLSVDFVF